ncbi:MAG: hypothetical protein QOF58_5880 [Pseudonocardiales bacterium]|nr:hypothetical protein [Pseudonocardiales bacterium]
MPGRCGRSPLRTRRTSARTGRTRWRTGCGRTTLQVAGQLASGLAGAHRADTGQLHVPPIRLDQAERAGGEPARNPGPLALEPREPRPRATPLASDGVLPVRQRCGEIGQPRRVGLLGVLAPPRRDFLLGVVPRLAQAVSRPRHRWSELTVGEAVGLLGGTLVEVRPDPRQTPVVRVPLPTTMRPQSRVLRLGRIEREPIRLNHRDHLTATVASGTDSPGPLLTDTHPSVFALVSACGRNPPRGLRHESEVDASPTWNRES